MATAMWSRPTFAAGAKGFPRSIELALDIDNRQGPPLVIRASYKVDGQPAKRVPRGGCTGVAPIPSTITSATTSRSAPRSAEREKPTQAEKVVGSIPTGGSDREPHSVGLDQRLQRGEVPPHGVGVTLELLVGHLRTLPKSEDHFAPTAVADDP